MTFADDVGSVRWVTDGTAKMAAKLIKLDNAYFDASMTAGNWRQNRSKQEHVINLRRIGQNKLVTALLERTEVSSDEGSDHLTAELEELITSSADEETRELSQEATFQETQGTQQTTQETLGNFEEDREHLLAGGS